MAINEYDDMLENPAPAAKDGNEYGSLLDEQKGQQKSALQQSMFVASKVEPDRRAKAMEIAGRMNLPVDVVERNFDTVAKQDELAANDYDGMIEKTPQLAKWLAEPANAAVAKDDINSLGKLEEHTKEFGLMRSSMQALAVGFDRMNAGIAKLPGALYDTAALPQNLAVKALGRPDLQVSAPDWLRDQDSVNQFEARAKANTTPDMERSVSEEISKGEYTKASRALFAQFVANAPSQAAIIAAALTGNPQLGLAFAGATTAADANMEARAKGIDPASATTNALTHGVIEAGFESLGTFGILKAWEGAIAKEYGKQVSREVFKDFGKTLAYSMAAEGNEEALTSIGQDFSDYLTGVNPDAFHSMAQRALDAGIVGAASGGAMTAPSGALAGAHRARQARQAEIAKDFLTKLKDSADQTKLKQRSPELQSGFLDSLSEATGIDKITIPIQAMETYFQSQKINTTKAMQELGALEAYTQAKEQGTDMEVPLSQWVDKMPAEHYKALANDVRIGPNDLSINEHEQAKAETQAELEKAAAEVDPTAPSPELSREQSAKKVAEQVREQLKAAGVSDTDAKTQALLYEARIKRRSELRGEDPQALFEKHGLSIGRGEDVVDGQTLEQSPQLPMDLESRLKRAESMGVNTETTWYHGTSGDIKAFDPNRGNGSGGAPRGAIFLTRNPKIASSFAGAMDLDPATGAFKSRAGGNVIPVFVAAKKTFDYQNTAHVDQLFESLSKTTIKAIGKEQLINGKPMSKAELRQQIELGNWNFIENTGILEAIKANGFDSMNVFEYGEKNLAIFDPSKIRSVNAAFDPAKASEADILFQDANAPRGQISFGKGAIRIDLLKDADPSTFLHETGHLWLHEMGQDFAHLSSLDPAQLTEAQRGFLNDGHAILNWLGAESFESITVEQNEQFARGTEAYLMEGTAPTEALRAAFARFKIWLTSVYRQIKQLNVELTPEVRSVMDRMLATEEQIEAAQREQNIRPLFVDPMAMGMSEKQAHKYLAATFDAQETAKEELNAKLMAHHRRVQSQIYQEEQGVLREEISKEVSNRQIYKAIKTLTSEKMLDGSPLKLNRDAVKSFGKDVPNILPRGTVAKKGEGIHPNVAAELLGFDNGNDLISQLSTTLPLDAEIDRLTDIEMNARHPDLLTDGKLPEEAFKAIHNQSRTKLLRMELEHLASDHMPVLKDVIKRVTRRMPTEQAIRDQARKIVGAKTVKDLKPELFQRAEIKAAKDAGIALTKGDIDGAFEAKRRELLNHELYRATVEAKTAVKDAIEDFKKLRKSDETLAKARDMDLVNTARAILAEIGIGKSDKKASEYLEPIRKYDADTFVTVQALMESIQGVDMFHSQLKFDDFITVRDTIDAIWDLAKSTREITIDGQKMDRDVAKEALSARLDEITKSGEHAKFTTDPSDREERKLSLLGAFASIRRVESWADMVDGSGPKTFKKFLVQPVVEAIDRYRLARTDVIVNQYQKFVNQLGKVSQDPIFSTELGHKFENKAQLLGALLHSGNESNFSKLLRGRNWGELNPDGTLDSSKWDAFIARMQREGVLTKADYDYLQATWDMFDGLKAGAQKAHKQLYGHYFNEITAKEFSTPFGIYKGGYAPAVANPLLSEDAAIRNDQAALDATDNSFMFPTTGRGFSKSRVDQYAAPLSIDLGLVFGHIDKVLRFTHVEPAVKEVSRIVMDKGFRQTLGALDPTIAGDMLVPWLQRAASQRSTTPSQGASGKAFDKFANYIRKSTSMQIMSLNFSNALQNTTGLFLASLKVKPTHLSAALWDYSRSPTKTANVVAEKSEFMRSKLSDATREAQQAVEDMLVNPTKYELTQRFAIKTGQIFQRITQNMVDITAWSGAYRQAVTEGMSEREAVRHADSTIRQTQGAQNAEDISTFESGSPTASIFKMFYGYFNNWSNLLGTEFTKTVRDEGWVKGSPRLVYLYAMGLMLPSAMAALIAQLAAGKGLDADDDGDFLDDFMSIFFGSQIKAGTAMIPGAGMFINSMIASFNDNKLDDKVSVSPVVSTLEAVFRTPKSIYDAAQGEGSNKRALKDTFSAIGILTGLPAGALARPLGYAIDINEAKADPSNPLEAARGFITGQSGKR